ncbi:hypothetical protein [Marinobacter sp. CHS3-4]|uniref:hypothetical protein n=1 Tax=Marinobacter sp. CHS3-4 TaxID=3045174 RepID=UPI0024B5B28E|nr:hypothetical protein [Marinobacter sp. CHS3-4]MDI9244977.1 hypothetical protein [Marinobacter sp. CHS3-4]
MTNDQNAPTSFDEALKVFESLEKDEDLARWQIDGVHVWKLVRFPLFRYYRLLHGIGKFPHPEIQRLRKTRGQFIKSFWNLFVFRNPFLYLKRQTKRVVILHSRKQLQDDRVIEPISSRVWLSDSGNDSLILDRTSPGNTPAIRGAPDNDVMVYLGAALGKLIKLNLSREDLARIDAIKQAFGGDMKINGVGVAAFIVKAVRAFKGQRAVYKVFFRLMKLKALYVVVSYGREAPIAAAQELGMVTAEFQHGSMDRGHLGYDFRGWDYVPYFPCQILVWGEAWYRNCDLPTNCKVKVVGAPHMENAILETKRVVDRREKSLLVLSQGPIRQKIVACSVEFARERPDWNVTIRPHPNESSSDIRDELDALAADIPENIEIKSSKSFAEASSSASAVLGVNSTALIEASLAGCGVAILRLPESASNFKPLVDVGSALIIQNGVELAEKADELPAGLPRNYFSEPVDDVIGLVEG